MPNLSSLANIPGYGAYIAKREMNEQAGINDLKEQGVLMAIQDKMRARKDEQLLKQSLADSSGDLDAVMQSALKAGRVDVAAKISSIIETRKKKEFAPPEILKLQEALGAAPQGSPARTAIEARIKKLTELSESEAKVSPLGRLITERDALPQGDPRRKAYDAAIASSGGGSNVSSLGRLIAERDALPEGDPRRKSYDAAIAKAGDPSVQVNLDLGKEGRNKVDAGLLDTTAGLMKLSSIEGQFRPEFQQFGPRLSAGWSALKEKAGVDLNPNDKTFLTAFSSYKRNAVNAMNEYIKSITGAAMSEAEAQRIIRGMPNPGQGMLDGDSPTEFKSKLDDAMKQTKLALARYEYIKRNGIALTDSNGKEIVPLERMPQIMNARGKALEEQIRKSNPNAAPNAVQSTVRGILAKEFGLVR